MVSLKAFTCLVLSGEATSYEVGNPMYRLYRAQKGTNPFTYDILYIYIRLNLI